MQACLSEASDAKLDPVLLQQAVDKLKVAELAQRVYAKAKEPPGQLAIDVLERELAEVGGEVRSITAPIPDWPRPILRVQAVP